MESRNESFDTISGALPPLVGAVGAAEDEELRSDILTVGNTLRSMDVSAPDKRFALRLATMVDSRLIWYEHFAPWADALIMKLEAPPHWLLELSTIRDQPDATRLLRDYTDSPPFESDDTDDRNDRIDEYVACLFLRYRRGDLSWASFLREPGQKLDAANGRRACEEFYSLLTDLEHREYAKELERIQCAAIEREFQGAIERIDSVYRVFVEFFRRFVAAQGR